MCYDPLGIRRNYIYMIIITHNAGVVNVNIFQHIEKLFLDLFTIMCYNEIKAMYHH